MQKINEKILVTHVLRSQCSAWRSCIYVSLCSLFVVIFLYSFAAFAVSGHNTSTVYNFLKNSNQNNQVFSSKYSTLINSESEANNEASCETEEEPEFEFRCEYVFAGDLADGLFSNNSCICHFQTHNQRCGNQFVLIRKSVILQV